ncbi:unnamed protein product [Rangifer tarandus platyrhynchus]|uniref:Uncharacterized protein n=1 Tax=Rangifer tarandus platyrhynchus TaxID=3082113 RepID=A0AC59YJ04_RANTA
MPIPMAVNVPKVPPLCIMVFLMPPISSRPRIPILRQEKMPKGTPAAMPTVQPITKPIFTRLKQLGWDCPWGPTATSIWLVASVAQIYVLHRTRAGAHSLLLFRRSSGCWEGSCYSSAEVWTLYLKNYL